MYPCLNVYDSIKHILDQLEGKYRSDIAGIEKNRSDNNKLFENIVRIYIKDPNYEKLGHGIILPAYYILKHEFTTAWILALYLNIRWWSTNVTENKIQKMELQSPEQSQTKPFCVILDSYEYIRDNNYAGVSPFSTNNREYNNLLYDIYKDSRLISWGKPYDVSGEGRYSQVGDDKHYFMSYHSVNEYMLIYPIAFRQERYDDVAEMLFRFRYILSTGEPPKIITEGPKHRHFAPYFNMYDRWFQARFINNEAQRKSLAWEAVYWYLETGLRSAGTTHIRDFIAFTDFCEIIGEFDLMEERQDEFLRNFKKWTMHASISHYKKMQANPIKMIPFSERDVPTYDEFKALYDAKIIA